jgi:photosystem II stability/assembly factor-like uncharacterized protein
MLVSCDMSGSYRSLDGGRHWEMIHCRQIRSTRSCRPLFLQDATYWATGPDLRVSRDKAKTWKPVLTGAPPWEGAAVTHIAATSAEKPVLFVGTDTGLWRSADVGRSWERCQAGKCYAVVPLGAKVYASVDNRFLVSSDDGKSWKEIAVPAKGERGFLSLAGGIDKSGRSSLFGAVFEVGILKSDDEGRTWRLVDEFRDCNDVLMARTQTEVVYAAQTGHSGAREVWRTRDGGKSWQSCFRMSGPDANVERSWVQTQIHWGYYITPLGFGISPGDPNLVLVSTQGDFYVSRDGGDSWNQVMNIPVGILEGDPGYRYASNGLEVTSCWELLFDPFDEKRMYIAYTDIGFARSVDRGKTWIWSARGCPWSNTFYQVIFDPRVKGRMYAATSNRHDIPHWTHVSPNTPRHAGGVCVSEDHGISWQVLGKGLPGLPCTSIAIDPASPAGRLTLYTTLFEGGVYKSTDGGSSWVKKSEGLGNPGNLHAYQVKVHPKTGALYCSVTAHRVDSTFPVPGGLWKSTDGGESWRDITKELKLHWPGGFALHPDNPDVIYLTASTIPGGREGGIYKTTDGGRSWKRLMRDEDFAKTDAPSYVHCMFVNLHPDNPDSVYAGTGTHGLWLSEDAGKSWKRFEEIPFKNCQNVSFDPRDRTVMYVTTFGGGVWRGPHLP